MTRKVLVAGIGNIFLGDDGFGVEVVRRLVGRPLPAGVEVVDVGIRGVHLAYQLMNGYDALVLVDAAPRGGQPGDLFVIEPDVAGSTAASTAAVTAGTVPLVDAHGMEPGSLLSMLDALGGQVERVVVVACEPGDVSEGIGLTTAVEAAVPRAVELVEEVVANEVGRQLLVHNRKES